MRIAQIIGKRRVAVIELVAAKRRAEAGSHTAILSTHLIAAAQGKGFTEEKFRASAVAVAALQELNMFGGQGKLIFSRG